MKTSSHFWIQCSNELPRSSWWAKFLEAHSSLKTLTEEKWTGAELKWPAILDSARSFTLFARQKIILIQEADKCLKSVKDPKELFKELESCAHIVVLLSEKDAPKTWPYSSWKAPMDNEQTHDKALFRWVDQIDRADLRASLRELDWALESGQHPLVCLQILTRHYRMGRLITYAHKKGLRELEMTQTLKLPKFVVEKWLKNTGFSQRQWNEIFYRLSEADLHLKSGFDQRDLLRKLSHDLCQIKRTRVKSRPSAFGANSFMTPSLFGSKLWPVAPSFS